MAITIENKLTKNDLSTLIDCFQNRILSSVTLFAGLDLDFIKTSSLTMSVEDSKYTIDCQILLQNPIGLTAWIGSRIDPQHVFARSKSIRLHISKPQLNIQEIENDISISLELLEHVANYSCEWQGFSVDEHFVLDSEFLRSQLELHEKKEMMVKRGETARPFEAVHAESSRDARKLAGDLIPIYVDYDKWDFYGTKKVYRYLPRSLVMKLLRCNHASLMPEDLFDDKERDILEDLVVRKYLKKRKVAGKVHYFDLNEKTIRHFLFMFRQK